METLLNKHLERTISLKSKYKKYNIDKNDIYNSLNRIKSNLIGEQESDLFDSCLVTFFNTLQLPYSDINMECFDFISCYCLSSGDLSDICYFINCFLLKLEMLLEYSVQGPDFWNQKRQLSMTGLLTKDMSSIFCRFLNLIDMSDNPKPYIRLLEFYQKTFPVERLSLIEEHGNYTISNFFGEINKRNQEMDKPYFQNFCNRKIMLKKRD